MAWKYRRVLQHVAHAVDLPALDLGAEILAQHLQPADQPLADIDVGDFQRAFGHRNARDQLFGRGGADEFGALLRERPQFAGILKSDPRDQIVDRNAESPASRCRADGRKHSSRHAGLRARRRWRRAGPPPAPPSGRPALPRPRRCRRPDRRSGARAQATAARAATASYSSSRSPGGLSKPRHEVFLNDRSGACHLVLCRLVQ